MKISIELDSREQAAYALPEKITFSTANIVLLGEFDKGENMGKLFYMISPQDFDENTNNFITEAADKLDQILYEQQ